MKYIQFDFASKLCARYDSDIHEKNVPTDAVEVSDELFFQTINEQDGVWTLGPDGSISKKPFPAPTKEELVSQAQAKVQDLISKANPFVTKYQDMIDVNMASPADAEMLNKWKTYRVLLNRLDVTAKKISWPVAPE